MATHATSGIPFDIGIIKNRYIHRTFIQPTAGLRKRDVKMKLNPIRESVEGKRIVLVDDSVVRGTTMRQVVQIVREAGARQVHLMISSPPVLYPDFYGINTPDQADLIAAHMSLEEMRVVSGRGHAELPVDRRNGAGDWPVAGSTFLVLL